MMLEVVEHALVSRHLSVHRLYVPMPDAIHKACTIPIFDSRTGKTSLVEKTRRMEDLLAYLSTGYAFGEDMIIIR